MSGLISPLNLNLCPYQYMSHTFLFYPISPPIFTFFFFFHPFLLLFGGLSHSPIINNNVFFSFIQFLITCVCNVCYKSSPFWFKHVYILLFIEIKAKRDHFIFIVMSQMNDVSFLCVIKKNVLTSLHSVGG